MPPKVEEPVLPEAQSPVTTPLDGGDGSHPQAELIRSIASLLSGAGQTPATPRPAPSAKTEIDKWQRRRVLMCLDDPQLRERIRAALDSERYELFSASLVPEATELLHESRAEVLVLSPSFDSEHQGGAAMISNVGRLTPQKRRRTYVILVSPQLRTMDTYLAFANGVNLTIHPEDVDSFQAIFERSMRDFNELYRPMNIAMEMEPF
jgi:PleD family two-component response regulator